jgi:hypothetical protein
MNQKTTPTPAELAAQNNTGQGPTADQMARMNAPLDVGADYRISGQTLVAIYQLIDEIPMKFARQLLPAIQMNIDKLEGSQD